MNEQLEEEYGVTITAVGQADSGNTPDGAARVMDTGVDSLGNALIIQESYETFSVWNEGGGSITFSFTDGVHLEDVNVLRSKSSELPVDVTVVFGTGETEQLDSTDFVPIGEEKRLFTYSLVNNDKYVSSLIVEGPSEFAITELKYMLCPGTSTPSLAPSPALTSLSPTSVILCLPGENCGGPGHEETFEPTGAPIFAPTEPPVSAPPSGPTDSFICVDEEWMSRKDYDDEDEF